MTHPDEALKVLGAIQREFHEFCSSHGRVSEADTGAKVIDRVLRDVLAWPESMISREDRADSGFLDYCLSIRKQKPYLAVEAKREGIAFTVPIAGSRRSYKLDGSLVTAKDVKQAILQVRQYCDDNGLRYAVATNGYAWIVFRAIRDDIPWRRGHARVFSSLEQISEHFSDFWNMLSFEAVCAGRLETEFGLSPAAFRSMHRVVDKLAQADAYLRRNRLNSQLQPIIKTFFEDISQQEADLFRSCYVYHRSLRVVAEDLNIVITDAIPKFLRDEDAEAIIQTRSDSGVFGDAIEDSVRAVKGDLYLLLGGIGSGKTTFLKRYERLLADEDVRKRAYWFHVDFLGPPIHPDTMEDFVWKEILNTVRAVYAGDFLESRRFVKKMFADKITAVEQTLLQSKKRDSQEYEDALSPQLDKWQDDLADYVPRLLQYSRHATRKAIVLVIDNVDQLDPEYQSKIFLLAQHVTRIVGCTTVVSLREESYYTASVQKTFTAYTSRRFHIASPHFRTLIMHRINYAIAQLRTEPGAMTVTLLRSVQFDRDDICDFLKIVQNSIFRWSRVLAKFIEATCFGNMRMALEMFSTFLTSGATDVNKMLLIYRRDGQYHVAFHEFLKSIMLGDRRYYKEEYSRVMNVFNCNTEKNSSHFTAWRILDVLLSHRGESNVEGRGYVDIGRIVGLFENIMDNAADVIQTLERLLRGQLIEANTRSTETLAGASHVRVTSCGWYYIRHLVYKFAYLDLVLQDTPLDERRVEESLRASMYEVDNLGDREDNKIERVSTRFRRVQEFLSYLGGEEDREFSDHDLGRVEGTLGRRIVPVVSGRFEAERAYIERRLLENRARFAEDYVEVEEEGDDLFGLFDEGGEDGDEQAGSESGT